MFFLLRDFGKVLMVAVITMVFGLVTHATGYVNMDFTGPETGSYQTVFGSPSVRFSVGPLHDALVFEAVTEYQQVGLTIPHDSSGYQLHFDVLTHNFRDSDYAFTIFFDTPEVRSMSFLAPYDKLLFNRPIVSVFGGPFYDDQIHHIDMLIDFSANTWTTTMDGELRASMPFNADQIQSIRFGMAPWPVAYPDSPGTYAAIDNLTIATIPEPPTWSLILSAFVVVWFWSYRKRHAPKLVLP